MKKKFFAGIAVLAIATMAAFNVNLNTPENDMSALSLANVEALAYGENGGASCDAGGPGASSCSISQDYPGGLGSSKSVTCNSGYYACCTKDTWGNLGARCVAY
jgi:hypothetical protein